mmetsp:Transcript_5375/g.7752  ORF Transcript_5375/g.7752 Transcript_5375/m.7752 type:complete len:325 (-) Transcript_5375:691-1665(-)|eukprot:CAMPEP_0194218270 /NCGR_PEP_ID=MMETSP0156-20130528/23344_1 /TAXON_ID=33649 /ORGANISM="Thalassionema nitzschioides, Strain L26-B" /LENGTH=324 /DNA_ID=CAMNT_0038947559 /DNA_START=91 /DNA_END=1065 /DNA_ORIENTATION=-
MNLGLFGKSITRKCTPIVRLYHVRVVQSQHPSKSLAKTSNYGVSDLVDNLIQYTKSVMENSNNHVVAFSGGVDSSLVVALLQKASEDVNNQTVQPVIGISPAVSSEQIQLARQVTSCLGVQLTEVRTSEGIDDTYIANAGEACLACKTHLYTSLKLVLNHASMTPGHKGSLYNGTNADDVKDPTRLGLIAASNFDVISPLQHTTKNDVRRAAKYLGLPNWNYAASPCLRSRLALGVEATKQHLIMIEEAEKIVKKKLSGYSKSSNIRVRMLSRQRARVEVDDDLLQEAENQKSLWTDSFQNLGFSGVDVKVFTSGSVSRKLEET